MKRNPTREEQVSSFLADLEEITSQIKNHERDSRANMTWCNDFCVKLLEGVTEIDVGIVAARIAADAHDVLMEIAPPVDGAGIAISVDLNSCRLIASRGRIEIARFRVDYGITEGQLAVAIAGDIIIELITRGVDSRLFGLWSHWEELLEPIQQAIDEGLAAPVDDPTICGKLLIIHIIDFLVGETEEASAEH